MSLIGVKYMHTHTHTYTRENSARYRGQGGRKLSVIVDKKKFF